MVWITADDVILLYRCSPGELSDMFIAIADGSANEETLLNWINVYLNQT